MSPWAEREARRIEKARTLIQSGIPHLGGIWADLGCGAGIFTSALHTLIRPGGMIYAVDASRRALESLSRNFADSYPDASLHPVLADFTQPVRLPALDGLIMANSLHFIGDKQSVLSHVVKLLKSGGRFILVEYNASHGNTAVPYPIDETGFLELADAVGLRQARILAKIPSTFLGQMYAGMAFAP